MVSDRNCEDEYAKLWQMYGDLEDQRDRLRELLRQTIDYMPLSPIECRGSKCREPWCISCFEEYDVQAELVRAKETMENARIALQEADR